MNEKTLSLDTPLTINGKTIRELQVRRPLVRDRLAAETGNGSAAQQEVTFLANLCTVAPKDLEGLTLADYQKLQEMVTGFLSSTE